MKIDKEFISKIGKDKLLLMAAAGIVLLLCSIPSGEQEKTEEENNVQQNTVQESDSDTQAYVKALEKKLENLIEEMSGVSKASVMITIKNGEGKEILKDESVQSENTVESDGDGGERNITSYSRDENTIYYKNSAGEEIPYILSEICPQIEGVAVVAEGADSPQVKEKIIGLIKALFGIEINKIMVTV